MVAAGTKGGHGLPQAQGSPCRIWSHGGPGRQELEPQRRHSCHQKEGRMRRNTLPPHCLLPHSKSSQKLGWPGGLRYASFRDEPATPPPERAEEKVGWWWGVELRVSKPKPQAARWASDPASLVKEPDEWSCSEVFIWGDSPFPTISPCLVLVPSLPISISQMSLRFSAQDGSSFCVQMWKEEAQAFSLLPLRLLFKCLGTSSAWADQAQREIRVTPPLLPLCLELGGNCSQGLSGSPRCSSTEPGHELGDQESPLPLTPYVNS